MKGAAASGFTRADRLAGRHWSGRPATGVRFPLGPPQKVLVQCGDVQVPGLLLRANPRTSEDVHQRACQMGSGRCLASSRIGVRFPTRPPRCVVRLERRPCRTAPQGIALRPERIEFGQATTGHCRYSFKVKHPRGMRTSSVRFRVAAPLGFKGWELFQSPRACGVCSR